MAKSNRRKKQDRARADAKRALAQRRQDQVEQDRLAQRRLELIHDPATPSEELAGLLDEHYEGSAIDGGLVASLLEAGYDGYWELEVFSDDGTYGNDFPDSYWKLPHAEFLALSKAAFDETYADALRILAERRGSAG